MPRARAAVFLVLGGLVAAACADPQFSDLDAGGAEDREAGDGGADAATQVEAPACFDDANVLGAECPGVVLCTSHGLCDQRYEICCTSDFSAECAPRQDCGTQVQLRCDGAEDCAAGQECCQREAATWCVPLGECAEPQRTCHSDADCDRYRCADGMEGTFGGLPVVRYKGIGFCRGL
jgi:hypothetical protein